IVSAHDGYPPVFLNVIEGTVHEIKVARMLDFDEGSIIAVGRGYMDYKLLANWTRESESMQSLERSAGRDER
ncbi:MAG TPA: hypothetical protein PKK26_04155, partial [Candidatus Wallbacteria bacterium]|nr:hypothetical protein [Candidatus Wallbacteria bacterium]